MIERTVETAIYFIIRELSTMKYFYYEVLEGALNTLNDNCGYNLSEAELLIVRRKVIEGMKLLGWNINLKKKEVK